MKYLLLFLLSLSGAFASIGNVASMTGDAKIVRAGLDIELTISSSIELKDLIVTQGRTRVQVLLNDDTVITIGPNSEFGFDAFDNGANPEVKMSAKKGFFRAMSGHIGKIAPNRFKIKTRSATIGIRGTHFMGQIGADSEQIACIRGAITVTTSGTVYEIPSGKMISLEKGVWEKENLEIRKFKNAKMQGSVSKKSKKAPRRRSSEDEVAAVEQDSDAQEEFLSDQIQQEQVATVEEMIEIENLDPEIVSPEIDFEEPISSPVGFIPTAGSTLDRPETDISSTGQMN